MMVPMLLFSSLLTMEDNTSSNKNDTLVSKKEQKQMSFADNNPFAQNLIKSGQVHIQLRQQYSQ